MKPIAFAIIAATGLIVSSFAPRFVDQCIGACAFSMFAILAIIHKDK